MTKQQIYELIGELAIALYTKEIRISLTSLNSILADKGCEYGSNRGVAAAVSAAYRHWKEWDPVLHHTIAHTYVDKDGKPPWLSKHG